MLHRAALPPFKSIREHLATMTTGDLVAGQGPPQPSSSQQASPANQLPIRTHSRHPSRTTSHNASAGFDIVAAYRRILASDPDITMPIAAIEALIELLGATQASTSMETVDVIRAQAERLHASVRNPVPLRAGTDLFQQHILRSLKAQAGPSSSRRPGGGEEEEYYSGATRVMSFDETRAHLLANSKSFVDRAKAARRDIAEVGCRLVREGSTVLTAGGSRTVLALLLRAAERQAQRVGSPRFRVVYAVDAAHDPHYRTLRRQGGDGDATAAVAAGDGDGGAAEEDEAVAALRARGVEVATVDAAAVAYALRAGRVAMVLLGTEAVVQNGGLLSRMGTFQLATIAQGLGVPLYVAAETHKIARVYPLGQLDLGRCGVQQTVLDFRSSSPAAAAGVGTQSGDVAAGRAEDEIPVDYTPPDLITSFIMEHGIKKPSAIYDMVLDIYT